MGEKLVVFMDDVALLPDLSGCRDVLVVSLDTQAASELDSGPSLRVTSISQYSARRFASYDELYDHYKAALRERFRPKDPLRQSRFLFEIFWDDILLNLILVHYVESLIEEILERERPTRFDFAISDLELDSLFRLSVERLT